MVANPAGMPRMPRAGPGNGDFHGNFNGKFVIFLGIYGDFMGVSMGKWMNVMIPWELIGENM